MENTSATNKVTMMILPTRTTISSSDSKLWTTLVTKANKQFKELEEKGFHVIYNKIVPSDTVIVFFSFWTSLLTVPNGNFFTKDLKDLIEKLEAELKKRFKSVDDLYTYEIEEYEDF